MIWVFALRVMSLLKLVSGSKKKPIIYLLVIIWLIGLQYYIYQHFYQEKTIDVGNSSIYDLSPVQEVSLADNLSKDKTIDYLFLQQDIVDDRGIDSHSTIYSHFFAGNTVNNVLSNLNFQQRCDLYFKNLFKLDINWNIDPNADLPLEWRDSYSFQDFRKKRMPDWKKEFIKNHNIQGYHDANEKEDIKANWNDLPVTPELEAYIEYRYNKWWAQVQHVEQKVTNYLSHLRIFNKCYVTSDDTPQKKMVEERISKQKLLVDAMIDTGNNELDKKPFVDVDNSVINSDHTLSCEVLEKRVYPWLSLSYPIYERYTGEKLLTPPQMENYLDKKLFPEVFQSSHQSYKDSRGKIQFDAKKNPLINSKTCFLNQFKNSLSGKGIVLSIGDKHVEQTVNLIKLLRALGNKYPIQVVYFDGLSQDSKKLLYQAARDRMLDLPHSFTKVQHQFPENYLDSSDGTQSVGLPPQELWFVNVNQAIRENYRGKFQKYGNKFFATFFNSFEEYILLDADSVLIQSPETFFNLQGYKDTGALFFRDRTAFQFRPKSDGFFFKKMSPSIIDNVVFDFDIMTNHTMNREYFDGMDHYMESGVVIIDRNMHFNSVLMILQLNMLRPAQARSFGDKELFWLGFAVNGDENYHFNEVPAASLGERTDKKYVVNKLGAQREADELCSCHPGHISGEDKKSLLWFNSGFTFCGQNHRVDFEEEATKNRRFKWLNTADQFKHLYYSPMKITHAIIPPFKEVTQMHCPNDQDEPDKAWHMESNYCRGYLWCAYSRIGGTKNGKDNSQAGTLISFGQENQDLFTYYGDIWSGSE